MRRQERPTAPPPTLEEVRRLCELARSVERRADYEAQLWWSTWDVGRAIARRAELS